jgi:beta-glucosidase
VKELKAFRRVELRSGEALPISFLLDMDRYYDPAKKTWVFDLGKCEILVGASSRDIRARATYELSVSGRQ